MELNFFIKKFLFQLNLVSYDDLTLDAHVELFNQCLLDTFTGISYEPTFAKGNFSDSLEVLAKNTDFYSIFLSRLAHRLMSAGNDDISWSVFALNKMLHSVNISPSFVIPKHFRLSHGVGTVIGKAEIADYFFIGHGCTVGASADDSYPRIGSHVSMRANCQVLGKSVLGNNVIIGAGVTLINTIVPNDSMVINENGSYRIIQSDHPLKWSTLKFSEH